MTTSHKFLFLAFTLTALSCEPPVPPEAYECSFAMTQPYENTIPSTKTSSLDASRPSKPLDHYGFLQAKIMSVEDHENPEAQRISCPAYVLKRSQEGDRNEKIYNFDTAIEYNCFKKVMLSALTTTPKETKKGIFGFLHFEAVEGSHYISIPFGDPKEKHNLFGPVAEATFAQLKLSSTLLLEPEKRDQMITDLHLYKKSKKSKSDPLNWVLFNITAIVDSAAKTQAMEQFSFIHYKVKEGDSFVHKEEKELILQSLQGHFSQDKKQEK